jgi:ribosomal protein S18 acetylase RimI-like enzyme
LKIISEVKNLKDIPASGPYQYIYQKDLSGKGKMESMPDYSFRYVDNVFDLDGGLLKQMLSLWGMRISLRNILRVSIPSKKLYCLIYKKGTDRRIVFWGWINIGRCKRYKIDRKDVFMDFIWTHEKERRQGLATYAIGKALNVLSNQGYHKAYIDTFIDNVGTQALFKKCGFHGPVKYYLRTDKKQAASIPGR